MHQNTKKAKGEGKSESQLYKKDMGKKFIEKIF